MRIVWFDQVLWQNSPVPWTKREVWEVTSPIFGLSTYCLWNENELTDAGQIAIQLSFNNKNSDVVGQPITLENLKLRSWETTVYQKYQDDNQTETEFEGTSESVDDMTLEDIDTYVGAKMNLRIWRT